GYKTKANFTVENEKQISTAPTVDFSKPAQPAQQPPAQPQSDPQPQH
ncbi:MAG TPA: LemA family protein, partial [Rhodanobacteraceae bacterium]|nr:LemA family protein [Rhodanobacteraceae bacterium]